MLCTLDRLGFLYRWWKFFDGVVRYTVTAEALSKTNLTVRIGTKHNRSDLVTGRQALLLPCLGRTEIDAIPACENHPRREQIVSTENSMVSYRARGTVYTSVTASARRNGNRLSDCQCSARQTFNR